MNYIILIILFTGSSAFIGHAMATYNTSSTKSIKYKTIGKFDGYEIREYPDYIVASTPLNDKGYKRNARQGFRRIASYIFGGNSSEMNISMTSPVQMNMGENSSMSFFMPEDLSYISLPEPFSKDVYIKTEPAKTVAAIEFAGWANDRLLKKKYQELKSKLIEENIPFENNYIYLGYNPPYQLLNRRNEVLIKLK